MATPHVLVIDDDPAIAGLFAATLREEGAVVDCVTSPAEALAVLARPTAFSVVVTRPFAGDATPCAWLAQLRARTHAAIVLCVESDRCAAYQAHGDVAVLELPCDLSDVAEVVAAVSATPR